MMINYLTTKPIADGIDVQMGGMRVTSCLTDLLVVYGLGACVGVCIYDPAARIAGLAHIVLPTRQPYLNDAPQRVEIASGKFADSAVPQLIDEVCRYGGSSTNLRAAVVGGARIFSAGDNWGGAASRLEIGERNIAAVVEELQKRDVPIIAIDVGGCHGRTVTLRVCDGTVTIRPIGEKEAVLAVLSRSQDVLPVRN